MGHCDAGLGGCSHQLTRSRAQARHRGGMKERACQKLDEVSRSTATTLHQDWEREPVAGDTLCLWACFSHGSAWPSLRFRYQSPKFWVLNQAHLNRQLKIKLPPAVSLAQETSFYPQHFLQLMLLTWASLASQFTLATLKRHKDKGFIKNTRRALRISSFNQGISIIIFNSARVEHFLQWYFHWDQ